MNNENNNSFNFKKLPWGWILLGITLWFLFPWIYSVLFDFIIRNPESYGSRFGAVGDIYGSLNAFVSSVALCAVAYSTWLQVTSLKETREATARQLDLAEKNHKEQLRESQNSIFLNTFTTLLNQKNTTKQSLQVKVGEKFCNHEYLFIFMADKFAEKVDIEWKNLEHLTQEKILIEFLKTANKCGQEENMSTLLTTYFFIYKSMINLIKNSYMNDEEKEFYFSILRNTMSLDEQITLMWLSSGMESIYKCLNGSGLLWFNFEDRKDFILKFQDKSHFNNPHMIALWSTNN